MRNLVTFTVNFEKKISLEDSVTWKSGNVATIENVSSAHLTYIMRSYKN
jgi:hypothetical protein